MQLPKDKKWYCGYAIVQKLKKLHPEVFDYKLSDDPIVTVMAHKGADWMDLAGFVKIQKEATGRCRWVIKVSEFWCWTTVLEDIGLTIYDVKNLSSMP